MLRYIFSTNMLVQRLATNYCLACMLKTTLLVLCITAATTTFSQQLGLSTGISIDANNHGRNKQVPLSLQWIPQQWTNVAIVARLDAALPLGYSREVTAYTLQSGLSPSAPVRETIRNSWMALSIGARLSFPLRNNGRYLFADFIPAGIGTQRFKVNFKNYNRDDYEILNPDTDQKKTGVFVGAGFGFVISNFVAQVHAYTPLLASKDDYKLSYKFNAPISVTIGYLLPLSGKK